MELRVFRQHVGTAIQNDSSTTWPPQIGTTIQNDTLLPQIGFEVYNTFCWEPEVWTARWHNCSFYRWPYLYLLSYEKTQRYATTSRFCLYHFQLYSNFSFDRYRDKSFICCTFNLIFCISCDHPNSIKFGFERDEIKGNSSIYLDI